MKKRIYSILMVVVMTMALVACGTKAPSSPVNEVVETESDSVASEPEQATEAPVDSLVADNVAIDGEFGDATGITVEKLDVAECEAFASYITDKTTAQAVYDIGLTDADKNAVQPDGTVNVTITVPDEMIGAEGDNYLVYFINADAFSQVEVVSVTSDTVTFETEHFSVYAVVKFDSNVISETDFVRNSEEIAENSEAVSTPETSTEENSEAVSESDSEAVVEPEFTITEVTATKYATQSVNVRSGPSTDYDKIGGLTTNQEVQVTGQASTGWWRIQYNGGEAYVSDKYLADEKVEKPVDNSGSSGEQAQANSGTPEWTAGVLRENYGQYEDGTYWTYTCGVGAPTSSFWTNVCNIIDYEYIGRYNVNVYHLFNGEYKYSYLTDRDVYKVHCRNINCIYAMDN